MVIFLQKIYLSELAALINISKMPDIYQNTNCTYTEGRAFARYDILNIVFLHVEQEMLAYKTDLYSLNRETELIVSHNTLVGGGYRQTFQKNSRSAGYIMLLFNLNETIHTPYSNPVLRVGFEQHF
jgi:hypothetical protein